MASKDMDKLVSHAKTSGFVYQGSEIYDGLANTWDYGPLGVEMKNNIKQLWWKRFIQESPYNVGLDSAIFMNPRVWEASGHVGGFSDPLIDCKECKTRHRADKLIEAYDPSVHSEGWSSEETVKYIKDHNIVTILCCMLNCCLRNIRRLILVSHGEHLYALLLCVDLQLLNCSRTVNITCYQKWFLTF